MPSSDVMFSQKLMKSDKNYMRNEIVSFMTQFNFIMFLALLGIVSFQKLNSGGFYIGFDYFTLKISEVLRIFDTKVTFHKIPV